MKKLPNKWNAVEDCANYLDKEGNATAFRFDNNYWDAIEVDESIVVIILVIGQIEDICFMARLPKSY